MTTSKADTFLTEAQLTVSISIFSYFPLQSKFFLHLKKGQRTKKGSTITSQNPFSLSPTKSR